jgi:beta-galactosidase
MDRRSFLQLPASAVALGGAQAVPVSSPQVTRLLQVEREALHLGAVYFRKSNPPKKDWERDHRVAAEDGHTLFRHWVPWNAVEVAPGKYEWDDYDRMLDLAAGNNIRVILAEMLINCPEWLIRQAPSARSESRAGYKRASEMHASCVTGGNQTLCLDHPAFSEPAERFLTALATRYRGHPALLGYDIWNECSYYSPDRLCFCEATQRRFRAWLQARFGDVQTVASRWNRLSLTDWEDVQLARQVALFADVLDTLRFQLENAFDWMRWRRDVLRRADPDHLIVAHGNAKTFADLVPACGDDWRAAEIADLFGYTYFYANACHPFLAADLIRSASRGKTFWRAEAVGDSDWSQRKLGRPRPQMDKLADPANIRLDCMISLAAGARAYQNPRWRPLLDGPLFGAYGWYGMDGSRTERSGEIKAIASWAHGQELSGLRAAAPLRGEVGILIIEECQGHCYCLHQDSDAYSFSLQGAYGALLDANVQVDFVRMPDIAGYRVLYIPYPLALSDATSTALLEWVRGGGHLFVEGCFGYFNELAHAFEQQPNRGWAEAAGCVQERVSFALDLFDNLQIEISGRQLPAGVYRQSYLARGGRVTGRFADGGAAVVQNGFGKGAVTLIGSMLGYGYYRRPAQAAKQWFQNLPAGSGLRQRIAVDQPNVTARVWRGNGTDYVWVVNHNEAASRASLTLSNELRVAGPRLLRGDANSLKVEGNIVSLAVNGRDAAVLAL